MPHDIPQAVRETYTWVIVFLVLVGLVLSRLSEERCRYCDHCRNKERLAREAQEKASHDYYHRTFGAKNCEQCRSKDDE